MRPNHTRSRARTRTRSPLPDSAEASLAAEPASAVQQCTATPVLLLKDSSEPRQVAKASCLYVRSGSKYLPGVDRCDSRPRPRVGREKAFIPILRYSTAYEPFSVSCSPSSHHVRTKLWRSSFSMAGGVSSTTWSWHKARARSAPVPVREIIRLAIKHDARGVVFGRQSPRSGRAEPSYADILATQRVKTALEMVQVRLVDHFIIADKIMSFAERGLIS